MVGIHNAPVVVALLQVIVAVKIRDGVPDLLDEAIDQGGIRAEDVVGCNARLAGVEELAPNNPLRSDLQIHIRSDHARRLAAKLERDGGEVLRCRGHDDAANSPVAGVEDVVPLAVEQLGGFFDAALDNAEALLVEVVGQVLVLFVCLFVCFLASK